MKHQTSSQTQAAKCDRRLPMILALSMAIVLVAAVAPFSGCKRDHQTLSTDPDNSTQWQSGDNATGAEIVERMRNAYASATSYADRATLSISYRLQGRYLEEPHQWAVEFERPGRLKCSAYNVRLRADGQRLGCFIYDFSSGNLDRQWLVYPIRGELPLQNLFQDGICRHYATGQSDVPVDQANPATAELFFPVTAGLLTGEAQLDWLGHGTATRTSDRALGSHMCQAVEVEYGGLLFELLIDATTSVIREIRFPPETLDSRLQGNPEVEELRIVARFEGATFQAEFPPDHFSFFLPADAVPVNRFVAVPEPFPSAHIGKPIPASLGLRERSGQPVVQTDWSGKVTLLAWSGNSLIGDVLKPVLEELSENLDPREFRVVDIRVLPAWPAGDRQLSEALKGLSGSSNAVVCADPGFLAGQAMDLDAWPVVAVVDRQGFLQFVKSIDESNVDAEEIRSVLRRVRSGDHVSVEMRREYEAFLDDYQQRLAAVRIEQPETSGGDQPVAPARLPEFISVRQRWTNNELNQPGAVAARGFPGSDGLLVLDGWRTVRELDRNGNEIRQAEINLAPRESLSLIRAAGETSNWSIAWSIAGRGVRVIDDRLQSVFAIDDATDREMVRDAMLTDWDDDGVVDLLVSYSRPRGTDRYRLAPDTKRPVAEPFVELTWRDSASAPGRDGRPRLVVCGDDGSLKQITRDVAGEPLVQSIECSLGSVTGVRAGRLDDNSSTVCVIGTDARGDWQAVVLDDQLQERASAAIGSQHFDTQIEPMAFAALAGSREGLWLIVARNGSVRILETSGRVSDRWNLGFVPRGVELVTGENGCLAIFSSDKEVTGWEMQFAPR